MLQHQRAVTVDKFQLEGIQVIQVPPLIISSTETPGSRRSTISQSACGPARWATDHCLDEATLCKLPQVGPHSRMVYVELGTHRCVYTDALVAPPVLLGPNRWIRPREQVHHHALSLTMSPTLPSIPRACPHHWILPLTHHMSKHLFWDFRKVLLPPDALRLLEVHAQLLLRLKAMQHFQCFRSRHNWTPLSHGAIHLAIRWMGDATAFRFPHHPVAL